MQGNIEIYFSDENDNTLKYIGFVWDDSHRKCEFISNELDVCFYKEELYFVYIKYFKNKQVVLSLCFDSEDELIDYIKIEYERVIKTYYRKRFIKKLLL